jgi:cobalt/nickel transport system ATP-binding protein
MNAIEVKHLAYMYPDGTNALKDVSFCVQEGEHVALIGANGAGKTTLFFCLNGVLDGTGESINIFGMSPNSSEAVMWIRKKVGMVFQNPDDQIFCPTVYDDVAFGPLNLGLAPGQVDQCVLTALEKVRMTHCSHKSPHHLSLGEKKKVCIAGVLVMQPSILLLDEPTSDLDPKSKRELISLLKGIGGTQVISTHDFELVFELADRILILSDGRIVADGETMDILLDIDLLRASGLEETLFVKLLRGAKYDKKVG